MPGMLPDWNANKNASTVAKYSMRKKKNMPLRVCTAFAPLLWMTVLVLLVE